MAWLEAGLERINGAVGGIFVPLLLFGAGLYFCLRLRFFRCLHPMRAFREIGKGKQAKSSLRALFMALAGTLGVGNITGVALALRMGGAGAVFWMWVSGICAMVLKYSEITLAMGHRQRGKMGENQKGTKEPSEEEGTEGGAMYYIRDVMAAVGKGSSRRGKVFGGIFAGVCLATAFFMGGMMQANAASETLSGFYRVPTVVTGVVLSVATAFVIFGGGKKIASLTARMIPVLTILYVVVSLVVILRNIAAMPRVLARIFREAFSLGAVGGGGAAFAFSRGVRYGVMRGLLSNEAGCGTAPMAHTDAKNSPAKQGLYGVLEVFIDTLLLCTLTAFVVLLGFDTPPDVGGALIAVLAYQKGVGKLALPFLSFSMVVFAWGTVLCWAYYGEKCIGYFTKNKKAVFWVRIVFCALLLPGACFSSDAVVGATDLCLSLLTCINVPVLLLARREIFAHTIPLFPQKNPPQPKAAEDNAGRMPNSFF